eukprot:EG_transcript_50527
MWPRRKGFTSLGVLRTYRFVKPIPNLWLIDLVLFDFNNVGADKSSGLMPAKQMESCVSPKDEGRMSFAGGAVLSPKKRIALPTKSMCRNPPFFRSTDVIDGKKESLSNFQNILLCFRVPILSTPAVRSS